jgi:acyl carrier protein
MNLKTIILKAIKDVNEQLQIDELSNIHEETPLFQLLDSLGTLDLILELESSLEEHMGEYIAVANEESMDKNNTPFKTIVTLEDYLQKRITDESN